MLLLWLLLLLLLLLNVLGLVVRLKSCLGGENLAKKAGAHLAMAQGHRC